MRNQLNTQKLTGVALARRLTRLASTVSDHKRLVWAVATENIPRIRVVLHVGLKNKRGVRGLLEQVKKAATDVYTPRSFTNVEWALAKLFKNLGGYSISSLAHRALGLPSPESIRRHSMLPTIRISASYPTLEDVIFNIDVMFPDLIRALTGTAVYGYIIMVDEVKNEERSAWDPETNNMVGYCREHSDPFDMQFRSMAEPRAIAEAMRDGKIHLAKEMTVAAIGPLLPNPRDYVARPIHISGTCKSEDAGDHATLLETILSAAQGHPKLQNARAYSIASDGESKRGKALVKICLNRKLPRTSKIYPALSKMPLMNLLCDVDDLTMDKDYRHVIKRMRSALLRKDGISIYGVVITTQLLRQHLLDTGLTPELAGALLTAQDSRVNALLNPNDKQDVPLAYSLLIAIMNMPAPEQQHTPAYQKIRRALNLLGYTFGCWLRPYTTLSMSASEQLSTLSTGVHIWLALYADGRGQFVPVQLFGDAMHMFKNAAFTVAKMQVDNPRGDFYLCQEGSNELEKEFGKSRCMVGSDSNFDMLQGARRLTSAVEVAILFAEHPEWDRTQRRLHLAPLEQQGAIVDRRVDHIGPHSWTGDVNVSRVSLITTWNAGRTIAEEKLTAYGVTPPFERMVQQGNIDILHPLGKPCFNGELLDGEVDEEMEVRHSH
ncbi:hypothetical protein EXIGLDRAFT_610725 [Exidia glandulosa HHB12029]|uniref:Uncharacterized protein n=1 Tax=Exidia glandulosa HHB12029 TaxID=1314781 RepID=A0A165JU17_EXIGL|nr:hypothetical protein EXIGLDRAFT_610725 [Exidia glandulosa HHB12029]